MSTTELITPTHLARKAIIYIRQSTPQQVLTNQESTRLQYALKQRALNLGWRSDDIEIIDSDLGLRGASAAQRKGFQELVAKASFSPLTSPACRVIAPIGIRCWMCVGIVTVSLLTLTTFTTRRPWMVGCFWDSKGSCQNWSCTRFVPG